MSDSKPVKIDAALASHNAAMMVITPEWLKSIKDSRGLTNGQKQMLDHHTGGTPYSGKSITNQVANFLVHCNGYRNGRYSCGSI